YIILHLPTSTLFPYTTLFRSNLQKLRELLRDTAPTPEQMAARLRSVEKDVVLPVKMAYMAILLYFFYFSRWFEEMAVPSPVAQRSEEHTSELQSQSNLVCRLL